jgi:hypothetical protein
MKSEESLSLQGGEYVKVREGEISFLFTVYLVLMSEPDSEELKVIAAISPSLMDAFPGCLEDTL